MRDADLRARLIDIVREVQTIPYSWPGLPTAEAVERIGSGTCAGKHALARARIRSLGLPANRLMVVGLLAPEVWPDLRAAAGSLLEVHECLSVETPWAGPVLVDVTWPPSAVRAGLRGTVDWDARSDMACAVEPMAAYAIGDDAFRQQKELLRSRLYTADERARRDRVLAEIAKRAAAL